MTSDRPPYRPHAPQAWVRTLAYGRREALPRDPRAYGAAIPLMLDSTVYIDAQRPSGLPSELAARIAGAQLMHSAVAVSEMVAALGLLDPRHPGTGAVAAAIEATLDRIPQEKIIAPEPATWQEAAMIAGILARTQGFAKSDRRKLLNDALIFLSSVTAGAVLVTRNGADIDLLLRFHPDAQVIVYDRT